MKGARGPYPAFSAATSHLAHPALQRFVGHLLLDPALGARFLNGGRAAILARAGFLSAQERALLDSIEADTPHALAQAILASFQAEPGGGTSA
jgi:hypothetical protein